MFWLSIISPVVLGLTIIYCLLLLLLFWGLFRIRPGANEELFTVSVVMAAKDEERSIAACIRALLVQDYPPDRYEVLVVDDASTDATAEIVQGFAQKNAQVKLIQADGDEGILRAKKRALQKGIEKSHGDIILITDADCIPGPTWIRAVIRHFEPRVGLVAGHVREGGSSLWQKLRALERLSVAAVAAGAIGWGRGLTARGGNLSYRRVVFKEVDGFKALYRPLSGDDDLFVQLVSQRTAWQLKYVLEPEATVTTEPPKNLHQFLNQERRRTSKGKYYPLWMQMVLVEVFLMNVALAVSIPLSLCHPMIYPLPLLAFAMKALCELLILIKASKLSKRKGLLEFFPLAVLLHIPYFLVFSIWGSLGGYRWKGKVNEV